MAITDLALVQVLPDADRVVLLGVGSTVGVSLAALLLLAALRRAAPAALAGTGRTAVAGIAAAALGLGAALLVPAPAGGVATDLATTAGLALLVAGVFLAAVRVLDAGGLRVALRG